jgi:GT2 family glycosyltransferase
MAEGPAPASPRVSVIVVAYRSAGCLAACLNALQPAVTEGLAEAIVVDNASPDESAAIVERSFPWARLVRSPKNLGFAGGVNLGLRESRAPKVMLLNPDAEVGRDAIAGMLAWLDAHPAVGAVGPRVVRASGRTEVTAGFRPTMRTQVAEAFGLFLFARWVPAWRSSMLLPTPGTPTPVDVLSGCCMVIPRRVLDRVGPFDERFFMYVEDVDWCVRAREAGYEVHYLPQFQVRHERSHGGANESLTPMAGGDNLERYFDKHGVPHSKAALLWVRRVHDFTRMLWLLLRGLGGQPGAYREAQRFGLTLRASFARPAARA